MELYSQVPIIHKNNSIQEYNKAGENIVDVGRAFYMYKKMFMV